MEIKPIIYVSSSEKDMMKFPQEVKDQALFGLRMAQEGFDYPKDKQIALIDVKALKGFKGTTVRELRISSARGTFRVVYTVEYPKAIYVLHAFQKKSKTGIETPKQDIDLIESRLKIVVLDYKMRLKDKK